MIKNLFSLVLLLIPIGLIAQNDYVKPIPYTFDITLILNSTGQNAINGIVNSLNSTNNVKHVTMVSPTELRVNMQSVKQNLPSDISLPLTNGVIQQCSSIYYSNNEQILENFKSERVDARNLVISGLSTLTDYENLSQQLLQNKRILFVNSNLLTHEIYLIYDNAFSDEDLKKILLNMGKVIITNQDEYSLYY